MDTKRHPERFPTGRRRGKPICGLSAGCKSWTVSAEILWGFDDKYGIIKFQYVNGNNSQLKLCNYNLESKNHFDREREKCCVLVAKKISFY